MNSNSYGIAFLICGTEGEKPHLHYSIQDRYVYLTFKFEWSFQMSKSIWNILSFIAFALTGGILLGVIPFIVGTILPSQLPEGTHIFSWQSIKSLGTINGLSRLFLFLFFAVPIVKGAQNLGEWFNERMREQDT